MLSPQSIPAEYFLKLQPDFVLDLAKLYLQYCPSEPPAQGDTPSPVLAKVRLHGVAYCGSLASAEGCVRL